MSKGKTISPRGFVIKWTAVIGIVVVAVVTLNTVIFSSFRTVFDNFFQPHVERSEALTEASTELTERIEAEGMILLENDGGLPLANTKVNVFGWSSTNPVYGGGGSGAVDPEHAVDFLTGLENAGIEYNTDITDFYTEYRGTRPEMAIRSQDWTVPEPTMDEYDAADVFESAADFSDTAVVMLSRAGGEGSDLPRSLAAGDGIESKELPDGRVLPVGTEFSTNEDDLDVDKHYLELSNRETAMLERVTSEFENVIVLLNTANPFELEWTDELGVDAVTWIGSPGESGFNAVGKMLTGEVNPSGRTVDTWTNDLLAHPTEGNFGSFHYAGSDELTGPENSSSGEVLAAGYQYVDYAEGIYVGYRYYETYYLGDEAAYADAVRYPFGYGLSYTSFEQTLDALTVEDGTATATVTVTNTGDTAGKDVAQLYVSAPYTEGGIEKSAVQLAAFDKTSMLEPGASEALTLTVALEDLASFDVAGTGAYVLEAGDYEFRLQSDSHELIAAESYAQPETVVYDEGNPRSTDQVAATTQFADARGEMTVLSRAGGFANHDEALAQAQEREMTAAEVASVEVASTEDPDATMPTTGADNGLTLADLAGVDYDDAKWDDLLDQITVDEMRSLITYGGYRTLDVASISKEDTIDIDGPAGLSSFMGASVRAGAYPASIVLASTWNSDLAVEKGEMIGYEALELGVNGWYAPGTNMHRSPFSGRNFEYYSEDPVLSGVMASHETGGAESKGLTVYIKHFALNDQEINRKSRLLTWADEQTIREIYLKPFEDVFKKGDASAVMSSFNYIGGTWAGAMPELLQTVLRDEWGFQGMVLTDYFGDYDYMSANEAIANGGDIMLSTLGSYGATPEGDSASVVSQMRTATKNILFTVANSNAMFTDAERTEMLEPMGGHISEFSGFPRFAKDMGLEPWVLATYLINGVIALLLLVLVVFKVRKYRRLFPSRPAADEPVV